MILRTDVESLEQKRLFERTRYEALYSGKVKTKPSKPFYGRANHGRHAWPQINKLGVQSLVDVGTGSGAFALQAVERKINRVAGVDFAILPHGGGVSWFKASAHDLPFDDGEFEWLTCFDTLEHLIPEELDEVLEEFRRVAATGWFFSVAYHTSHTVMGSDLHLIVRPKEWWKEKFSDYGEVEEYTEKYLWLRF